MPVSVTAAASAMARPRVRTRASAAVVVEHAGEGGGGDLADAVPGDGAGRVVAVAPSAAADSSPAATSSGCATAVSRISSASAFGAVVDQVEPDGVGPGRDAVGGTGEFEPGSQEAGRLGALAGSDEYEHSHTLSCGRSRPPVGTGTKNRQGNCWSPDKSLGLGIPVGQTPQDQRDPQRERGPYIGR